ncbi:glycosyltransferase [Candidatus Pelagibacter sp.]|nr:glycosyltransferase [Candidatus Pelagibacter sp.]
MKKPCSISVVLPTYNRISRLKKCLPIFLKTTAKDVQFIIIDNNSNDGTWDYLQSIAATDERVEIQKNSQNVGSQRSSFLGYCAVKSPYAIFLADDDLMVGDYIARCLEIFRQHDEVGVIHHIFDSLKGEEKKYNEPYKIFAKGHDAIEKIFMMSGVVTGFAIRMKNYHLKDFPLNEGVIYPQVKMALVISSKYDLAVINDCGMIVIDFGDTVLDSKKNHSRPDCMGINERLSYALKFKNPLLIQKLAINLALWAGSSFESIEKISTTESKKFIKSLVFTLNNITPMFIIFLFKIKKFKYAIFSLICLILRPSFLVNYLWFLSFVLRKIFSKLKLR